jgi:hypothetical protein
MQQQVFGYDTVVIGPVPTKNCFTVVYIYGCIIDKYSLR